MPLLAALTWATAVLAAPAERPERLVFAHYMVAIPTYGGNSTVADYQREIAAAQAHGVDGFALNCGGWSRREPHYKARTLKLYEAARLLGTGFKLFLSADYCCGLTIDETRDMIQTFADHPNQFRYAGKPVLSTFCGEGADNQHGRDLVKFLDELGDERGRPVVFVPYFYPRPNLTEHPQTKHVQQVLRDFPTLDGFFYFGAAGDSAQLAAANHACAQGWLGAGKLFMACITPYYRGLGGNYRCFETGGFAGVAQQWEGAIADRATWVEIVTWNDWGEASYVAPFGPPTETRLWNGHWGAMLNHLGYLDAMRYWVDWYKTGTPPPIPADRLFYAYRLAPNAVQVDGRRPGGADRLRDSLFLTLLLTAPATLTVQSGPTAKDFPLAAGVQHVELPFAPGEQRFVLTRDGRTVFEKVGEFPISATEAMGNFNVFTGSAP